MTLSLWAYLERQSRFDLVPVDSIAQLVDYQPGNTSPEIQDKTYEDGGNIQLEEWQAERPSWILQ